MEAKFKAIYVQQTFISSVSCSSVKKDSSRFKPRLHMGGRIASICLRPSPKEDITGLEVSIANVSCERLL